MAGQRLFRPQRPGTACRTFGAPAGHQLRLRRQLVGREHRLRVRQSTGRRRTVGSRSAGHKANIEKRAASPRRASASQRTAAASCTGRRTSVTTPLAGRPRRRRRRHPLQRLRPPLPQLPRRPTRSRPPLRLQRARLRQRRRRVAGALPAAPAASVVVTAPATPAAAGAPAAPIVVLPAVGAKPAHVTRQTKRSRLVAWVERFVQLSTGQPLEAGSVVPSRGRRGKRLRVVTNGVQGASRPAAPGRSPPGPRASSSRVSSPFRSARRPRRGCSCGAVGSPETGIGA